MKELGQILRENLLNSFDNQIQQQLEKKFPNKFVFKNDEPIKLGFHTEDYLINGYKVRLRFFSPQSKGDKSSIHWHLLTGEQMQDIENINKIAKEKKIKDEKEREELSKWQIDRLFNRR